MTKDDERGFAETMGSVYELYHRPLSASILAMWWEGMQPYTLAEFRESLNRHAMDPDAGQFIPKPADIVRQMIGTTADAGAIAWGKIVRALQDVGTWESVTFDDPVIHQVLGELGGWTWLGAQTQKEVPFVEKRFRDTYRAYLKRGLPVGVQLATHLVGHFEANNGPGGFKVAPPKMVGNPARAALIYSGKFKIEPGWEFALARAGRAPQLEAQS